MKERIRSSIRDAIASLREAGILSISETPIIEASFPKDESFGDYTSNIAMICAKQAKKSPGEIANLLKEQLSRDDSMSLFRIDTVLPGYLNFSYTNDALSGIVERIGEEGKDFGSIKSGDNRGRILLEFISANPTGPLHIGNARGGFLGDALSRVLAKAGYDVSTEYYVNDAGEQVEKLGHSVLKDADAVYGGEYIDDLHREVVDSGFQTSNAREIGEWAGKRILEESIKMTISDRMKIFFDGFVSEKYDIVEGGFIERAFEALREKELVYEQDEATWLKTTAFGDDKDRVLVKRGGERTYFASDCGYILHKKVRNFKKIIEIWGADHHGYVARFRAAAQALGFPNDAVEFILVQLVRLVRNGEEVRMSKRAGTVVSVDELLDAISIDVARFFFLLYSADTHMNFDLGLAEERSQKNPVYYVQYAHARMASILRKAEEFGLEDPERMARKLAFDHSKEQALIRKLARFPEMVEDVADHASVHQLPQYAIRLADAFHSFYGECVVLDRDDASRSLARLSLIRSTKLVLAETLRLMGVSAPEKM